MGQRPCHSELLKVTSKARKLTPRDQNPWKQPSQTVGLELPDQSSRPTIGPLDSESDHDENQSIREFAKIKVLEAELGQNIALIRDLRTELEILRAKEVRFAETQREFLEEKKAARSTSDWITKRNYELQQENLRLNDLLTNAQEKAARWERMAGDAATRAQECENECEVMQWECEKVEDANHLLRAKMKLLRDNTKRFYESLQVVINAPSHNLDDLLAEDEKKDDERHQGSV